MDRMGLGEILGIVSALITTGGGITIAYFAKKLRGPSDIREDKAADVAAMKSVAETALGVADRMKGFAETSIESLERQIGRNESHIDRLTTLADAQQAVIDELQRTNGASEERIAQLGAQVRELLAQRGDLETEVAALRAQITAGKAEILEQTLTPQAATDLRNGLHLVNDQE